MAYLSVSAYFRITVVAYCRSYIMGVRNVSGFKCNANYTVSLLGNLMSHHRNGDVKWSTMQTDGCRLSLGKLAAGLAHLLLP